MYKAKKSKTNWSRIAIIALLGLALIAFILQSIPTTNRNQPMEPPFVDMGDLTITDAQTGETLAALDIEIAKGDRQTSQGLMWRRSMADNQGMLFFMPELKPQSFWMLNTYISLDIIYVGEDKRVVSIAKNTTPKSTDPVPSEGPALYVLEVNAGFSDRHGIKKGDELTW